MGSCQDQQGLVPIRLIALRLATEVGPDVGFPDRLLALDVDAIQVTIVTQMLNVVTIDSRNTSRTGETLRPRAHR